MGPTTTTLLLASAAVLLLSLLPAALSDNAHDLVVSYSLPPGILPDNVVSYTLDPDSGEFTIELATECYLHFSRLVYYEKHLSGKVSLGKLTDLKGIQAKELFLWFSLSGIAVKPEKGVIEFQAGILSEELPAAEFYTIHECKSGVAGYRGVGGVLGVEKKASAAVSAVAEAVADVAEGARKSIHPKKHPRLSRNNLN